MFHHTHLLRMQILSDPGARFKEKKKKYTSSHHQQHPTAAPLGICSVDSTQIFGLKYENLPPVHSEDKSPSAASKGIASEMMNGHVCLSRWTGGGTARMGVWRQSTLSYPRCESRLTVLILETLQMSDLGRHSCIHAQIHIKYFLAVKIIIHPCMSAANAAICYSQCNMQKQFYPLHIYTVPIYNGQTYTPYHLSAMKHTHAATDSIHCYLNENNG